MWAFQKIKNKNKIEDCCCCTVDRNGIGNIRYQSAGTREVCICDYGSLKVLAESKGVTSETQDKSPIDLAEATMNVTISSSVGISINKKKGNHEGHPG